MEDLYNIDKLIKYLKDVKDNGLEEISITRLRFILNTISLEEAK